MKTQPLLHSLESADRAWRQKRAGELFLKAIPWLCLLIVIASVADIILHLNDWIRLSLSLALFLSAASLYTWLAYRAWIKKGPLLPVARLLEDRDPNLGSKLVNVLQLQEKADDNELPELTRSLAQRAVGEASQELENRDFRPLTGSPTMRRSAWIALAPLVILTGLVIGFSHVANTEWKRFAHPFGDHPPFAFTRLKITTPAEDGARVVYGQPTTIEVTFSGHRPKELFLTAEPLNVKGEAVTIPLFPQGKNSFVQQIDSVESKLTIRAHNRSRRALSQSREIEVILNPEVAKAEVTVIPPSYTQIRKTTQPLVINAGKAPRVSALVGSELVFTLYSNRPLSDGSVGLRTSSPEQEEIILAAGTGDLKNTATAKVKVSESGRLRFDLRDESGLSSTQELAANLVATHDLPPSVEITEPTSDGFIVENFEASIAFRASDDYGLRRMRIHTAINGNFSAPKIIDAQSEPPQPEMTEILSISPAKLSAKAGDELSFFADTTDIRPEAQSARTRTLKLQVISEDEYNDFLRLQTEIRDLENKYATLHDQLRELAQEQRELAEKASKANEDGVDQKERDTLAAQQSELNSKLVKLAKRMESATRDNPLYDLEKDLQKVLNEEAAKIRDSVARNHGELSDFSNAPPSPASMDKFGQEAKDQADRLDPAREEAEKKIADAINDAAKMQELLKAIAAYQQLYEAQQQLASQSAAFRDKSELSHEDKLALQDMAGVERFIGSGLKDIVKALRTGAEDAREMYPLAAGDAMDIADAIEQANLSSLADSSSRTMLSGHGKKSHQQAEHLREEMAKLISECQACSSSGSGEFTQRLSLMRSMMAGNTFSQMSQCRKFGFGNKPGMGMGSGMGMSGFSGSGGSQMGQSPQSLLGGESMLGQRNGPQSGGKTGGDGRGNETPQPTIVREGDGKGSKTESATRPSTSLAGDLFTDEYRDLVEAYFRKLTKKTDK